MKILITGATGFVGQNLSAYLKQYDIITLGREELSSVNASVLHDIDTVIHLAGKAHDLKKTANPEAYYQINFELTKALYNAFLTSNAKKFIFISSVKAVADNVKDILYEEEIPNPATDYGKSKLMAEQYIQNQPLPVSKSFYILRPCMIHGPGNKGNLNLLYQFVKLGIPYPLAAFSNRRSFLSITNLCFVIKALINKEVSSGIYNVADDQALSTNEVVEILAEANEKKISLWHIPKPILIGIAKFGNVLKLPLNVERLDKLTASYRVSNIKIINAIGLQLPINAKEGLIETAKSFVK